jgi:LysM repeat protein
MNKITVYKPSRHSPARIDECKKPARQTGLVSMQECFVCTFPLKGKKWIVRIRQILNFPVQQIPFGSLYTLLPTAIVDTFFSIFVLKFFQMNDRQFSILFVALIFSLYSCKTYKPLASASRPVPDLTVQDYVNLYKELAISEMKRTGIPASITLAQGIIESDCGHSTLAREANNHFGIKCHDDWKGPTIRHNDNSRNECFRKYGKAEESFYDHSDFLKSVTRYSFLFGINSSDYKAWAHGLKKAGYATNPDYANMLIRTIEENNLWYFDRGYSAAILPPQANDSVKEPLTNHSPDSTKKIVKSQMGNMAVLARVPRIMENNRVQYVIVRDGDTREKLENEFQLLKWELPKYNELKNDFPLVPGQMLYLQPKRDKAEPGKEYYNTVEGDTMYLISQRYGIKLKKLYEMNRMTLGTEPGTGKKIWLRSIKPVDSQGL